MSEYKVDFKSMPWEETGAGIRVKVKKQGDQQIRMVEYFRDMKPHWCERGHKGMVLQGRIEIEYDAETLLYEAGDGVMIPSGGEHSTLR